MAKIIAAIEAGVEESWRRNNAKKEMVSAEKLIGVSMAG